MVEIADIILRSGRTAIELALFVLLPVMVVMLTIMRLLEAKNVLDKLVALLAPMLKPFGLPGLGIFAMVQVLFVSFAAPVATLAMMDKGGTPRRHIAATLAMVLGMAQANVTFPMVVKGLDAPLVLLYSLIGGLIGAAATYYIFGKHLPLREDDGPQEVSHRVAEDAKGVLDTINKAGAEAFKIAVGAIPMLVLGLVVVNALRTAGAIEFLEGLLAPAFALIEVPSAMILPIVTKALAGGNAMMGVTGGMIDEGLIAASDLNLFAGFLVTPLDVAGVAVLISAGPRVAEVVRPALLGGFVAVAIRLALHSFF